MDRFYIITNKPKDAELKLTNEIAAYLRAKGKTCVTQEEPMPVDTQCILVLGGDGTLLQAAQKIIDVDIPLIGINLGSLGFMAEIEIANVNKALDALMNDEFEVEHRMMLDGVVRKDDKPCTPGVFALNDIVLTRHGSIRIVSYDIYVNGQFLNTYQADGVIVATPTGSTGYNMSAGGPIIEPNAQMILLTPICPHTLSARSIVLSADDLIEIRIGEGHNGQNQQVEVSFDGGKNIFMQTGDAITIKKANQKTSLVRINRMSFLEILHRKFNS